SDDGGVWPGACARATPASATSTVAASVVVFSIAISCTGNGQANSHDSVRNDLFMLRVALARTRGISSRRRCDDVNGAPRVVATSAHVSAAPGPQLIEIAGIGSVRTMRSSDQQEALQASLLDQRAERVERAREVGALGEHRQHRIDALRLDARERGLDRERLR